MWGPPGTGKTRVLSEAINALAQAGKRVLLVSSTNIAVDNALAGVLRHRGHAPGDLVRVGTPHWAEIASNLQVSLAHLVRGRLAEVDHRREELNRQLVTLREDGDRLAAEEEALAGFNPQADTRARALIAATDRIPQLAEQVHTAAEQRDARRQTLRQSEAGLSEAQTALTQTADSRTALAGIAGLQRQVADAQQAADRVAVDALTARDEANRLEGVLRELHAGSRLARWRNRVHAEPPLRTLRTQHRRPTRTPRRRGVHRTRHRHLRTARHTLVNAPSDRQMQQHQRTHPHRHPDSVMVTLNSFQRRVCSGGWHADIELPAARARWVGAQEHAGENIGTSETRAVFIELKEPSPIPGAGGHQRRRRWSAPRDQRSVQLLPGRRRIALQKGFGTVGGLKAGITVAGAAATAYSAYCGMRIGRAAEQAAARGDRIEVQDATVPTADTPPEIAKWQGRQRMTQVAVPVLAGANIICGSYLAQSYVPGPR
ncbi:hypothetical protein GCM10022255_088960 [Dactylosporangium darangshiense]|uniref:DNA2/NAM7 helicase helicase domain-containing protein n=1 Tax=Dactylosporangium darangshiense TaxID=579108 RepID=A0ABP8DNH8_9ACTN